MRPLVTEVLATGEDSRSSSRSLPTPSSFAGPIASSGGGWRPAEPSGGFSLSRRSKIHPPRIGEQASGIGSPACGAVTH